MPTKLEIEKEKLIAKADNIIADKLAKFSANLEEKIEDMLDRRLQELVAKYLGFDNKWGRWELDHCNGRSGNSAAGDFLLSKVQDGAKKWLDKQAGSLPDLPKSAIAELKKYYLHHLQREIDQTLRQIAESKGEELAKEIAGDIG